MNVFVHCSVAARVVWLVALPCCCAVVVWVLLVVLGFVKTLFCYYAVANCIMHASVVARVLLVCSG